MIEFGTDKDMDNSNVSGAQALALIERRQSIGLLNEPAPSQAELAQAIQAALAAPDHHRLHPWRFLQVQGEGRQALGQAFLAAVIAAGETNPAQLERTPNLPLRAPLILVAVVDTKQHPKVPVVEQVLSMGAAVQNLLLVLQAQGYATMWRTGGVAESPVLKQHLGLKAEDEVAGFIYIGTQAKPVPPRERLNVQDYLQVWSAP